MSKKDKKIEAIARCLPNCSSLYTCYTYGYVPKEKFYNACRSYAGNIKYEDCLGLIDETGFGSGKKGILFAVDGFYTSSHNKLLKYEDGYSFNSLSSSYNLTAFNELLHLLYEIETAPTGWEIAGNLAGTFLDWLQSAADELPNHNQSSTECTDLGDSYFDDDIPDFLEHLLNNIKKAQVCINEILEILDNNDIISFYDELTELSSILSEEFDDDDDNDNQVTYFELFDALVDTLVENVQDQDWATPIERINLTDSTIDFYNTLHSLVETFKKDSDTDAFVISLKGEFKKLNIILKKSKKMILTINEIINAETTM